MEALQAVVPVAVPEVPVEFVQATEVTLDVAVPATVMLESDVPEMVMPGEVTVSDGEPDGAGLLGLPGALGSVGADGSAGSLGITGLLGTTGSLGTTGATGSVGMMGVEIVKGFGLP